MTVSYFITTAIALIGSSGVAAIITALVNSRRYRAQTETEARAQFTSEFNAVIAAQNVQIDRLEKQVNRLDSRVTEIQTEHRSAEDYIDILIAGITNGTIPPIPPRI